MSAYYALVTTWALVSPFQYGYHTAALNQIQDVLTCQSPSLTAIPAPSPCVEMSKVVFGIVTASFTLGGFVGSSAASVLLERYGRRGALILNSIMLAIGSVLFAGSNSVAGLVIARLFIGVGCGIGLCALPLFLAETAPSRLKDKVGVLNQLSITIGILATQGIGLPLARKSQWRLVLVISAGLGLLHAILGFFVSDTPAWLAANGRHSDARAASQALHGTKDTEAVPNSSAPSGRNSPVARLDRDGEGEEVRRALLANDEREVESPEVNVRPTSLVPPTESVGLLELLTKPDLRRALLIVSTAMVAQQGSGINAVIYYSTDILKEALTTDAALISILVAVVNVLMTFAPVALIGKYGSRRLLMASIIGAFFSTLLLGFALDSGIIWLSSITILTFVASFALGLGPVPFMLTADLVPYYATSSLSSFALSLNWTANFLVGISFLPLRDLLAGIGGKKDGGGHGRVFYVFAALMAVLGLVISRLYRRR